LEAILLILLAIISTIVLTLNLATVSAIMLATVLKLMLATLSATMLAIVLEMMFATCWQPGWQRYWQPSELHL